MREILFRGKTRAISGSPYNNGKADGEWVKGHLYNDVGCWKIRQFETDYADYIPYEVDPETVGQYTGLTDKNGKKIFEGDIVRIKTSCNGEEATEITRVGYDYKFCGFFPMRWEESCDGCDCYFAIEEIEVIGNIHDNPELLKGGEQG